MKSNYGFIRSQQMTRTGRLQLRQQHQRNMAAAAHQYHQNRHAKMIKTGTCLHCEGSGTRFLFFTCSACNGEGRVSHCQACGGKGKRWLLTCRFCIGTGRAGH